MARFIGVDVEELTEQFDIRRHECVSALLRSESNGDRLRRLRSKRELGGVDIDPRLRRPQRDVQHRRRRLVADNRRLPRGLTRRRRYREIKLYLVDYRH